MPFVLIDLPASIAGGTPLGLCSPLYSLDVDITTDRDKFTHFNGVELATASFQLWHSRFLPKTFIVVSSDLIKEV